VGQSPATPAEPRIPVYQPVFLGSLAFVLVNFLLPVYTRQLGADAVTLALPWLPGVLWVAVAYTLSAVGRALSMPAEDAMVGDAALESDRGRIMGLNETAAVFRAALGPPAGGWVYEAVAPEFAFVMNGSLLLVAALLVVVWFWSEVNPAESGG